MSLVPIDLPTPDELRGRWSAISAVLTSLGYGDSCNADGGFWHYDDGGGNFVDLANVGDGRAVLFGQDHEMSQTYYGQMAIRFGEPETDLFAGAPAWWADGVPAGGRGDLWISFVYGFDGTSWHRASYDAEDGFDGVGLPALTEESLLLDLTEWISEEEGAGDYLPDEHDVSILRAAGPAMTIEQLAAVLGPVPSDSEAGVMAARRFA